VAPGDAAQEIPGAKEKMEGMAVGVVNVVEEREVEKGYVVVGEGVCPGVRWEDIVVFGLLFV
jgi:hypothetical protein